MARYAAVPLIPAALTAEDLAAFVLVHEAVISPDGEAVAYAARRMDLPADRYRAALHVARADGSATAIVWTDGTADDGSPRWSIDHARRIADWFDAHP